jgi:hypothetical protein
MSRTTQRKSGGKSPVKYWLSFKGNTGSFSYWNGTENVTMDKLKFVLLDTRSTITGWCDAASSRIWSNVVKTLTEELAVKTKGKDIATGLYKDIKEEVKNAGGNFTVNVYMLAEVNGVMEPCCLQLDKGGLKEWSDLLEKNKLIKVYDSLISCEKGPQQKKGSVKYYNPAFTLTYLPADLAQQANDFDRNVLSPYFSGNDAVEAPASASAETPEDSQVPF